MNPPTLLVVGGGPAGLAAVRAYRDAGGMAPIVLATDDDRPPYRRPPLTKEYLRGELDAAELLLEDAGWYAAHHVEVLLDAVVALDPGARVARTAAGREIAFTQALLATGAAPQRLPVPGADDPAVHLMRRVTDANALIAATGPGTRVTVVGSGFIGCEAAASLARRGAAVTLVSDEPAPQAARLGDEVGARIAGWLAAEGVALRMGSRVGRLTREADADADATGLLVIPEDGLPIPTEVVVLGAGIAPNDELARAAGLALGPDARHVRVDGSMATSVAGIWAAGDVTVAAHAIAGRHLHVEHWGDALAHGEVAGRAMAGEGNARWETVPGFWSMIGDHALKYAAWGDGHDRVEVSDHGDGAFTARFYAEGGRLVGVLTHERDGDYDDGREQIARETQEATR
jgi:3-phenylpropionate/trans-cinnamate dioxygenase ferredoxin reductase subunit